MLTQPVVALPGGGPPVVALARWWRWLAVTRRWWRWPMGPPTGGDLAGPSGSPVSRIV